MLSVTSWDKGQRQTLQKGCEMTGVPSQLTGTEAGHGAGAELLTEVRIRVRTTLGTAEHLLKHTCMFSNAFLDSLKENSTSL